jgi:CMP-N,N'-diacetyllegionaminic acid synthase
MLKLSDFIIAPAESLRAALQKMTKNRCGVLFVCDENTHIAGVLSDGDVRRTLLEDTLLVSPVDRVMNTDPITAGSIEEAKELLHRLAIVAVPVVDSRGEILEAVIENQDSVLILRRLNFPERNTSAMIGGRTVAIIPARGGSKRIPRKNLAVVGGKTLLARSIEAAKAAKRVSHVIVSTDDREIADAASAMGIDVPWLRPDALSADNTATLDVLVHALEWSLQNLDPAPQFGVLLEPTAPLRSGEQIDEAISLLANSDADCVASVSEVPHVLNPEELLVCENGVLKPYLPSRTMDSRRLRGRQSTVYVQNGVVYAFRIRSLLASHSLYGQQTIPLVTKWDDFVDIDTHEDLALATLKVERQQSKN